MANHGHGTGWIMRTMMLVMLVVAGCSGGDMRDVAMAGLGAPPPTVTVTARPDGLAVSWSSISVAGYSVLRDGAPIAEVNAPTTSYIDTDLVAGGTYCYAVAGVFDDGSETPASNPVCSAATGDSGAPVRTLIVPVVPPTLTTPHIALWADILSIGSGSQSDYVPLALPVGTTIVAARARVQDGGSGTQLKERIISTTDGNQFFAELAASPLSSGNGTEQTLTVNGPIVTAPATQYYVEVLHWVATLNSASKLFRLEIDVR